MKSHRNKGDKLETQHSHGHTRWSRMNYEHQKKPLRPITPSDVFYLWHAAVSSLPNCPLLHPHTPHHHHNTHTHTPTLLETKDIAMMGTKARRWKLRPDGTSNQGLITPQYITLRECVCVCVCYFGATSQPCTHTCTEEPHSIINCNWRMRHSGATETWRDRVIVVTLIYRGLSIHRGAHVSNFTETTRATEWWPLIDCLNTYFPPSTLPLL